LIHREFVRDDICSICHRDKSTHSQTEILPRKCAMGVLWDIKGEENYK
jgi:hypothetical protein